MKLNFKAGPSRLPEIQKTRLENERITYQNGAQPARSVWSGRPNYDGIELSYRGQEKRFGLNKEVTDDLIL